MLASVICNFNPSVPISLAPDLLLAEDSRLMLSYIFTQSPIDTSLITFIPAIPNSKYFTDSPPTIDRFWWGWAGLFDTCWYKSKLSSINLPLVS
jgi:hypothetical protein